MEDDAVTCHAGLKDGDPGANLPALTDSSMQDVQAADVVRDYSADAPE